MEIDVTELTFIGEDDPDNKADFSKAQPGEVRVLHQTLFQQGDEEWEKAETIGVAHMAIVIGRLGAAICQLVFVLEGDDTIVASGVLPVVEGIEGVGNGLLAVTGGTGNFIGALGMIDVEVMNPKKYHIVLGGTTG